MKEQRSPDLLLRPLTRADARDVFDYASDPEFGRFIGRPASHLQETLAFIDHTLEEIRAGKRLYWALDWRGRVCGTIGFLTIGKDPDTLEMGFGIARPLWGQGLINPCMQVLINLAFGPLGAQRLLIGTDRRNSRSIGFAQKFGFQISRMEPNTAYLTLERRDSPKPGLPSSPAAHSSEAQGSDPC